ncbi:hypothetical protein DPMN_008328 [Dreissena polymorpha]|uniref:Galactosylceramide sulfotransferase n=1 Tax=Dreissena polymorpha TaxID=45954 RepID=A0A9D4MY61_DREPO|nr:hypothetical protein DPMN_008328 [Dreissena polymorpha]
MSDYEDDEIHNSAVNGANFSVTPLNVTSRNARITESGTPERVTHVGFLKVHKAGSTTMQNLLFRFGLRYKLNIAVPKKGNIVGYSTPLVPPRYSDHYDILACHTMYSKNLYAKLLPTDAVRIAIIREPFERMVSAAFYYRDVWKSKYLKSIPPSNFIHNLVSLPEKYDKKVFSKTKNAMGYDFDFPANMTLKHKDQIQNYLLTLEKDFELVMTTDKFDESLVLLRRRLNWSIGDIVYYAINKNLHQVIQLSAREHNKFKRTSFLDYEIYEYFSSVLKQKLKSAENDFRNEVAFFKNCLTKVRKFCDNKRVQSYIEFNNPKWGDPFKITKTDCKLMMTKEISFLNRFEDYVPDKNIKMF